MKNWIAGICALCLIAPALAAEEASQQRQIERVEYHGASKNLYLIAKGGGWGAPSCPNATVASADGNQLAGSSGLLSLAMQAKASDSQVAIIGECVNATTFKFYFISIR